MMNSTTSLDKQLDGRKGRLSEFMDNRFWGKDLEVSPIGLGCMGVKK